MSGGTPAEAEIRYDGQDITDLCVIKESMFTSRAGGIAPGDCTVVFRDVRQRWRFQKGKTLELYIGGTREWDGYLLSAGYNYWFATHTANCEPCPHVTPRKLILRGADRNVLWTRRVLYNKADPTDPAQKIWPANTPDDEVLIDGMDLWLDQVDGLDYTSEIQNVGSPDPYVEFRVPGPTRYWGDLFREVAQSTGAVYYIDPGRKVVYADVETPDAPFGVSDRPASGQVGYRNLDILEDASHMINDAMVWGAGQGSSQMAFQRVEDAASIAAHGRWQNTGGFRRNLWQQESVNRVANSIVYGSPSSLRGHKDDKRTARFTVFEPGLRVAQKVVVESEAHGWTDTLPIRQMTIRFHSKQQAEYEVTAGHEIDEPWTTSEYYWPEITTPDPDPPRRECRIARYEDSGIVVTNTTDSETAATGRGSHRSQIGMDRDWFVWIGGGGVAPNKWTWEDTPDDGDPLYDWTDDLLRGLFDRPEPPAGAVFCSAMGSPMSCRYQVWYGDTFWYTLGSAGLHEGGGLVSSWRTDFARYSSGTNLQYPGAGFYVKITGTLSLSGQENDRAMDGGGIFGPFELGKQQPGPHLVQLLMLRAKSECHFPRTIAPALVEATLSGGQSVDFEVRVRVPDRTGFHLAVMLPEPAMRKAIMDNATATASVSMEWTLAKPNGNGILIGPDDPEPCVEVPLYGDYCGPTFQLTPTLYRTPSPYSPGSTKVYLNGIHQRLGDDYEETDPSVGRFTFQSAPVGDVTACYVATGIWEPMLPDTSTALFVVPTAGSVSGTFGPQGGLWAGAFWHGAWYDHFHNGVDFNVSSGSPVYAAAAGTVVFEDQAAGGTMIHIYHDFNGMRTTYAHLSSRVAPNYSTVTQGQLIGYSGASGIVTGAHLHWGLTVNGSPEDPLPYSARPL